MDKCNDIEANVRMEECYAGMSLVFHKPEMRKEIEDAIDSVKKKTGMEPLIFDSSRDQHEETQAIYLEFHDDVQRDSGAFFEKILKELHIDKCANETIPHKESAAS
jgi:hypothetical protein